MPDPYNLGAKIYVAIAFYKLYVASVVPNVLVTSWFSFATWLIAPVVVNVPPTTIWLFSWVPFPMNDAYLHQSAQHLVYYFFTSSWEVIVLVRIIV